MRKIFICFTSIIFLFFQSSLLAYSSTPKAFINELVSDAINKLADKDLSKDQKVTNLLKNKELKKVFNNKTYLKNIDVIFKRIF